MFLLAIKYFTIIYCSVFSLCKLLQITYYNKYPFFHTIFFSVFTTLTIVFVPYNNFIFSIIIILILLSLFTRLYSKTPIFISFTTSIIAFLISFTALASTSTVTSVFFTIFKIDTSNISQIYYVLSTSIIHYFSVHLIFRVKRLQNGMPFLFNKRIPYLISALGITIIILILIIHMIGNTSSVIKWTIFLSLIFLAIALLIWWRHKITQSYVEKLRVDEVELLYKEISDKDLEIEKLHAHNEQLSGIIHKDNKLIPAMEMAVRNYLQTAALMKPEDARQTGAELLSKLERMAEERTGIIHTYQKNFSYRQRSGLISIDAIVDYMENRASTLGIEYHYQFDKTLKEMLPAFITEDDAMHLLSDLIENAIIAATHSEKKNIHIHIGFIRSILFIDISDSGIPFTPETYEKFGNIQYTTHAEHGGSGIGLMDIAKLKRQYQFSLQIYEYPENETIYTKKIRILFDRKAHYLIQSYRAKELRSAILRNDLHVIPYSDKENP